jgi:hypothetical protein
MRIVLKIASYLLIAATLGFLGFSAWFASVWGFNPLMLFPLYMVGLILCGVIIFALRRSERRKPSANRRTKLVGSVERCDTHRVTMHVQQGDGFRESSTHPTDSLA